MDMLQIIRNNVEFCERSGVSVDVDTRFSWVSIKDEDGGEVYLQGEEADEFIDKARDLWNEMQVITMDDAYLFYAYDYIDCLE